MANQANEEEGELTIHYLLASFPRRPRGGFTCHFCLMFARSSPLCFLLRNEGTCKRKKAPIEEASIGPLSLEHQINKVRVAQKYLKVKTTTSTAKMALPFLGSNGIKF